MISVDKTYISLKIVIPLGIGVVAVLRGLYLQLNMESTDAGSNLGRVEKVQSLQNPVNPWYDPDSCKT